MRQISIFLILISYNSIAQSDTTKNEDKKWTVSTLLFSNNIHNTFISFEPNYLNGIFVKRKLNNFSFRIGMEHSLQKINEGLKSNGDYIVRGYYKEKALLLGFEKGRKYSRFRPYLAFDLIGMNLKSNYSYQQDSINKIANYEGFGIGGIPAVGFEFKFTNSLSISLESRLQLIYFYTKNTITNLAITEEEVINIHEYFNPTLKVFGNVTINVSF